MACVQDTLLALGATAALTGGVLGSVALSESARAAAAPEPAIATTVSAAGMRSAAAETALANPRSFRACRDARCTVRVRVGDRLPIAHRFGFDRLTVVGIGRGAVELEAFSRGGTMKVVGLRTRSEASCPGGTCTSGFSVRKGETAYVNAVHVRVPKAGSGHATINLTVPK